MIELGSVGEQITVILAAGADFVVTLVAPTAWPVGTVIALVLSGGGVSVTWTATISGTQATFDVPTAQVQPVINSGYSFARLYYTPSGGGPLLWGQGDIRAV